VSVDTIYVIVAVASGAAGWLAASLFYGWVMRCLLEDSVVLYPDDGGSNHPLPDNVGDMGYSLRVSEDPEDYGPAGAELHLVRGGDPTT
jgi:hypothetical protein